MKSEYIIVGDTDKFEDCLVLVCRTEESAKEALHRMLTDPSRDDERRMKGHTNFRIKEVKAEDCWWNDPFLAN